MKCDIVYKCLKELKEKGEDLSKCEMFCDEFAGEPIILTPDVLDEE